jgi:CheY-like chemotaxis protein
VDKAVRLQPDVVLLDLVLEDSTGWEVLAGLRADPRTADIPVIIASVVDEQAKGLAAGAAAFLVKPLTREDLRRALRAAGLGDAPATAAPAPAAATGARVLLAEDNETSIEVMAEYLEHRGYHLVVARNGREAVERAMDTGPDIIVMDIQMPELDGLEATRRLRTVPHLAETPIIALTALAMPGDRERCLAAGASEYLTKPVSLRQLSATIDQLLQR